MSRVSCAKAFILCEIVCAALLSGVAQSLGTSQHTRQACPSCLEHKLLLTSGKDDPEVECVVTVLLSCGQKPG